MFVYICEVFLESIFFNSHCITDLFAKTSKDSKESTFTGEYFEYFLLILQSG